MRILIVIIVSLFCLLPWCGVANASKQAAPPPPLTKEQAMRNVDEIMKLVVDQLWQRADYHFHQGDYDKSVWLLEAITHLEPTFTEAYAVQAWLLWSMNRDQQAIGVYLRGIKANPQHYHIYFEFGMYYVFKKKWEEAVAQFRQAVKHPCPFYAYHMLGHALRKTGKMEEAIEVWKKVLSLYPTDQVAVKELRALNEELGKEKQTENGE